MDKEYDDLNNVINSYSELHLVEPENLESDQLIYQINSNENNINDLSIDDILSLNLWSDDEDDNPSKIDTECMEPMKRMERMKPIERIERIERIEAENMALIENFVEIVADEPTLLELDGDVMVFGDIHGEYAWLKKMMQEILTSQYIASGSKVLFLGDYVDRGKESHKCIMFIMGLKILYPKTVFFLRGNHENMQMNAPPDGYASRCVVEYGIHIYFAISIAYEYFSIACVINKSIFCVHGGISPLLLDLDQLRNIKKPIDMDTPMITDLLWSDFDPDVDDFYLNDSRGSGVYYGPDQLKDFFNKNNLCFILRGHVFFKEGFSTFNQKEILSIHSSSNYQNIDCTPVFVHIKKDADKFYIFDENFAPLERIALPKNTSTQDNSVD
ncbi:MAG: metallophosphoesterase [Candidatus Aenigmarchaeota archaeon]|nr:metallophosphoesterase [Candidatus Aenigmarchaeota archaeon]